MWSANKLQVQVEIQCVFTGPDLIWANKLQAQVEIQCMFTGPDLIWANKLQVQQRGTKAMIGS